jgi:hypothetical protein
VIQIRLLENLGKARADERPVVGQNDAVPLELPLSRKRQVARPLNSAASGSKSSQRTALAFGRMDA